MTLKDLFVFAHNFVKENPGFKNEVESLIELAIDEIRDGNSEQSEVETAIDSINELKEEM